MAKDRKISDSAFLVNESRARDVALSRDIYAEFWVTPKTGQMWEEFTKRVYPHDAVELGIRNRFFLEHLNAHANAHPGAVFVNIAAGFTSYPFLMETPRACIEIDYPHIVGFKEQRLRQWQNEGRMPHRPLEFLGLDLNDSADLEELETILTGRLAEAPSLVLLEGITYYLKPRRLARILEIASRVQIPGSILTFDFWESAAAGHPGCIRFKEFLAAGIGHLEPVYNHFDVDYVRSIPGYQLIELTDVQEQEHKFSENIVLTDRRELIFDTYAVLEHL